ncbi:doubled CXXCH domain-containing protein [Malonomonas rubra DSM 5091]|uniref:Doubled CXXCH domain-containing protein n=1 Tax=Malonomonas rubra DSM 5091 TaxID=1122189 RepID=A0A1M6DV98_MALRU|nr:cytochrome c3 family protein [Malonomonas rubra]SHI77095.1 doubled CXXCH domain-containing protein [Malonomonas rubra DSM 5091]
MLDTGFHQEKILCRLEQARQLRRRLLLLFIACALLALAGCDSVARHKVLTTVFDGVPELPQPERLCDEYYEQRQAYEASGKILNEKGEVVNDDRSSHKPYAEKACNDCHSSNKDVNDGLIAPKRELCGVCHTNFITGLNVHGPVAVGDCLACHLPHSSNHKALLKEDPDTICATCHQEDRLAAAMHDRFVTKEISCGECHDPHSGDARYFLK